MSALAAGLLAVASGGAAEGPELLYAGHSGVHVLGLGSDSRTLHGTGCDRMWGYNPPEYCPAFPKWSPDGQRVAIAIRGRIYVWDARTGRTEELRTHVGVGKHFISWSPDGARIAFIGPSATGLDPQLYVQEVEGARRTIAVTTDRWVEGALAWSPDGAWIAYAGRAQNRSHVELYVVAADGSAERRLTHATGYTSHTVDPVWSPAGDEIAFAGGDPNHGLDRLRVAQVDTGAIRDIATAPRQARHLQWTNDGNRLLLSASRYVDTYPVVGSSIWSVNVDGSGSTRLTEGLGDYDVSPSLSPNGGRLAFARIEREQSNSERWGIYVANPDGTCQRRVGEIVPLPGVYWRPGAGVPTEPIECRDLMLSGRPNPGYVRDRRLEVSLVNKGGAPVTDVTLDVSAPGAALTLIEPELWCRNAVVTMHCDAGTLEPDGDVDLIVAVRPRIAKRIVPRGKEHEPFDVTFKVGGRETELEASNNVLTQRIVLAVCRPEDSGQGRLVGTPVGESICGRRGRDRIRARAGDDRVQAGSGDDWIDGGSGRDDIEGQGGNDVVLARDGAIDHVACGTGRDRAVLDRKDRAARDCERVVRR